MYFCHKLDFAAIRRRILPRSASLVRSRRLSSPRQRAAVIPLSFGHLSTPRVRRGRLESRTVFLPAHSTLRIYTSLSLSNMCSSFTIKEHVIDASHIREYAHATAHSQEEVLKLAIKQYTPKDNPDPQPGDITVISSPANGFPKVPFAYLTHPEPSESHIPTVLTNLIGALRAFMGRLASPVAKPQLQDPEHMDRRRSLARTKRHPQR